MSDDHDFEPAYGLPERLPATERLLWQGSPDWRRLARDVLHLRMVAVYFALMLAWRVADQLAAHASAPSHAAAGGADSTLMAIAIALWPLPLALAGLGVLAGLAWLMARTTVYTITDRRVVMRVGIVLTVNFNLPFRCIRSAALHAHGDGLGDIALVPAGSGHLAYAHLWPHARPWRLKRTEPMLRALPEAEPVARLLAAALAEAAGQARPAMSEVRPVAGPRAVPEALAT